MDVEKFISLVHEQKCLWDPSDPSYHLRDQQRKAWKDISKIAEISVDELKKKWRGLRDTFGKELRKHNNKSDQSASSDPDSNWIYFKHLLFLRNTMTRRDVKTQCETFYVEENANSNVTSNPSAEQTEENTKKIKPLFIKKLKRQQQEEIDSRLLEIEEEKLKYYFKTANDSDAQYLMSLLPFLKDVPKHRKLMVRAKLQQVFLDEQNEAFLP